MTIRPASPDDVPAILPLIARLVEVMQTNDPQKYGSDDEAHEMYRGWLRNLIEQGRAVILVADAAGHNEPARVIGFIIGTIEREIPIYRLKEFGFLHDLWVEESYRHEGVGRQLVIEAVERFTHLGVKQIRLDVLVGNGPARKLFAACGFRDTVIEMLLPLD